MSRESATGDLIDIAVDEYCTAILTATSAEPVVVNEIVDAFGMSPATAYRRLAYLREYDLVNEWTRLDETGNQVHVYEAQFQSLKIEIINGITYLHIVREDDHEVVRLQQYQ